MKAENILVTGGAGYIGSFMVKKLGQLGYYPIIIDNLSNGFPELILYGELIEGDICDSELIVDIINRYNIKNVFHFAAFSSIKESFEIPREYMTNNYDKSKQFFRICIENGVNNLIFSSTCAVYGIPVKNPMCEENCLNPINPYGESKKYSEIELIKMAKNSSLKYAILRYFNVAGADSNLKIGEVSMKNDRLFKIAAQVAVGKKDRIYINGLDYNTPDGTAIRDYIHLEDIVNAHFDVLNYLKDKGPSDIFNVGYGRGWSVREIIDKFRALSKKKMKVIEGPRRKGDPPCLIADSTKIRKIIGWKPKFDDINLIVESSLKWEEKLMNLRLY